MATTVLSPERAMRRPWRLDGRVLVGLFIAALAIAGSLALWQRVNDARPVVVATRDLPTGATLAGADLAVARVRVDDGMYAAAVPADELGALVGRQLAEPVHPQQMVVRQQVSARPLIGPDQVALTIPVNPASAAGGRVRPGDNVAIILTTNKGKPEAQTTVVLPRVTVYDVGYDQGSAVVSTGAGAADRVARGALSSLTLVVKAPTEAVELASARHNGELDVALLAPAS